MRKTVMIKDPSNYLSKDLDIDNLLKFTTRDNICNTVIEQFKRYYFDIIIHRLYTLQSNFEINVRQCMKTHNQKVIDEVYVLEQEMLYTDVDLRELMEMLSKYLANSHKRIVEHENI